MTRFEIKNARAAALENLSKLSRTASFAGMALLAVMITTGCGKDSSITGPSEVVVPDVSATPTPQPDEPDLVISEIAASPASPAAGDEVTFSVFVKNEGEAKADRSVMTFRVGGESNPAGIAVPELAPGAEYRYERRVTLSSAMTYGLIAIADSQGDVFESNEGNNRLDQNITVGAAPKPDLTIATITKSPAHANVGELVTMRVHVRNIGGAPAPASVLAYFTTSSLGHDHNVTVPALDPGQEYVYTHKQTFSVSAAYKVTAKADYYSTVDEESESNNSDSYTFKVYP